MPADGPRRARLSGRGLSLWLDRGEPVAPLALRLREPVDGLPPPGCRVDVEPANPCEGWPRREPLPLKSPPFRPRYVVTRAADGGYAAGRAGMLYRDLLPDRCGGAVVASAIRIENGGPVPDYTHFHRVQFQMIYVLRGWVDVVYEGEGDKIRLSAGEMVTQPPTIRHRVLECSDGLEVLEIGAPAEHATLADHDVSLPDRSAPATFGGQTFVLHHSGDGVDAGDGWRETAVGGATNGLARVRVGAPAAAPATETAFAMGYVLRGRASLVVEGESSVDVGPGDFFAVPPGRSFSVAAADADFEVLGVLLDL